MKTLIKVLIYCRVSTDEQAKLNNSLESQERICREYALRHGYEIVRVFVDDGESAKTIDRPQLQNLLTFISQTKIDIIIFYKIDRWARNAEDYTALRLITKKFGVSVRSATENINDTPSGKFTENVLAAVAQLDNDVRSERTTTGMKQAILNGRWCWKPHIGYKHERDVIGKPILVPSEDAPFIQEAFQLLETGLYKQIDVVKELKKKGFTKLTEKRLNCVLRNPIYAGIIKVDWLPEPIDGIHRPLISKATFSKVQLILDGKRLKITPYQRNHPDFPLRKFVCCHECGRKLTGAWSTGRKGVKYAFYRCYTKGCSLSATKQELEHRFQEHLKSYEPNKDTLDLFEAILTEVWKAKQGGRIKNQAYIDQSIKNLQAKKNRLDELVIKGTMDDETYKMKVKEIREEILVKQVELDELQIGLGNNFDECLQYCKFFMSNIATHWADGDTNLKQRFQSLIFPEKIYYKNKKFETTVTACIFKRLQGNNPDLSDLVAPTGFEPVSKD